MMIKVSDGMVYLKDATIQQKIEIRRWRTMKENRSTGIWSGVLSVELLDQIERLQGLPSSVKALREKMTGIQGAVDFERTLPADRLRALIKPPVKRTLYAHQTRALNMAILVFGIVEPEEALRC